MISPSSPARGDGVGIAGAEPHHADALVQSRLAGRARLVRRFGLDGEGIDLRRAVMVDEELRRERRGDALQQAIGHRCASETQLAHGAGIGRGEALVAHEIVIERRHEIEVGHALALDEGERARHVEALQADEAAIDQRHGEQRAHPHGVIKRHDAERALAAAVEVLRHMRQRRGALLAVAARHALGPPGGARRVEHQRDILGARRRLTRSDAAVAQRREVDRAAGSTADRDARHFLRRGRARDGFGGHVLERDGAGFGVTHAVIELVRFGAPVERRHDHAREL